MAQAYTRQSSIADGDTITAALFNNEYNQLLNSFSYSSSSASSTGHRHDGTAGQGGNIHTIGDLDFLNKIVVDSTNNRWGVFVEVSSAAVEQIRIQDGAIVPVTDNDIDLGTSSLEFKDAYFDGTVYADAINFNGTAISSTAAELNILDGVTSTASELNIMDGDTSATSTTLADADRVVVNDGGTMKQVALTDFETYFESSIDTIANFEVTTELQTPLIAFTDGDDAIQIADGGGVTMVAGLTSTASANSLGATSFNDADITNVGDIQLDSITGDGDTNTSITFSGSDVITVTAGGDNQVTFTNGAIVPSTDNDIDLGTSSTEFKDAYFDGTVTTDALVADTADINGGSVDGATLGTNSAITQAVIDNVNINGATIGHTDDTDLITLADGVVTVAGELDATTLDISGNADIDGTLEADAITVNGTALATFVRDTVGTNMVSSNTESGITVTYDTTNDNIDFAIDAAQTTITSIYATDLIMGEDSQTAIDFGTANEIDFKVDNAARLTLTASALYPVTDNQIDLGTSSLEFKDAYFDGTVTSDAFAGPLTGDVTGTSSKVTVSDSTANTNFPVVFHDESDSLLDDTGALRYNPSSGTLLVPNLSVAGTTTTVDTVTMEASNAIIFEGATADAHETTLSIVDPTGDRTINLPNVSGTIPVLAAASTTQISSTPEELNILDGATVVVGEINALDLGSTAVGTAIASKAVILDSNKDYTGIRNLTITGELDGATLDISGDADIDGTLEADAITIGGVTLAETIADTVGAMVSSNTESGITVAYQDADNTLDFTVGTLNQDTTGTAAIATTVTITDNESTNEENAVVFTAGGDVDGGNLGLESDGNLTYNPSSGTLTATAFAGALTGNVTGNASGTAATVTGAAQSNITSLGTLTTLTVDNVIVNGTTIGHTSDTDLMTLADGVLTVAGELDAVSLDISGDVDIDGTLETDNLTVGGAQGSDGQVLTSTGSGVAWEDSGSGATFKTFGTSSIMIGDNATGTIDAANYNTGVGVDVFAALTTGDDNTVVGFNSGAAITTGGSNIAIGSNALDANTTGSRNVAIGYDALGANTTANNNTAVGNASLDANTTGTSNVAVGRNALSANTTADNNTAVGMNALLSNTTGADNTAVGKDALEANTTGEDNTAVGYNALTANTTGTKNTALGYSAGEAITTGEKNVLIGYNSGKLTTTGIKNVAVGSYSLDANTEGENNVAIGQSALGSNTTADNNTGVGINALTVNTTGTENVAVGKDALKVNTTGSYNTAVGGYGTLDANTTANNNTAIGAGVLTVNTTGANNTSVGAYSLDANTTGDENVAVGYGALSNNTTADYNTAVGTSALAANTTGSQNTAVGQNAGDAITTGAANTCLGQSALSNTTTSNNNTAIGVDALTANTTGSENAGFGIYALDGCTTGTNNTAVGYHALGGVTTSANNTGLGFRAGQAITTGAQNTSIGTSSGATVTTGSYNTYVGQDCRGSASDVEYETVIGYNQVGQGDGKLTYGKSGAYTTLTAGSTTVGSSSDKRIKENIQDSTAGLSFINDLQPKIFEYKKKKDVDPVLTEEYEEGSEERVKGRSGLQHGFIAQEVKEAIDKHPEIKEGFDGWEENPSGVQIVGESAFIPMLVKAVQELSAQVEELKAQINEEK